MWLLHTSPSKRELTQSSPNILYINKLQRSWPKCQVICCKGWMVIEKVWCTITTKKSDLYIVLWGAPYRLWKKDMSKRRIANRLALFSLWIAPKIVHKITWLYCSSILSCQIVQCYYQRLLQKCLLFKLTNINTK